MTQWGDALCLKGHCEVDSHCVLSLSAKSVTRTIFTHDTREDIAKLILIVNCLFQRSPSPAQCTHTIPVRTIVLTSTQPVNASAPTATTRTGICSVSTPLHGTHCTAPAHRIVWHCEWLSEAHTVRHTVCFEIQSCKF